MLNTRERDVKAHTVFHIEDEPDAIQAELWRLVKQCADAGIQMTPLNFVSDGESLTVDGMPAYQWVEAMTSW